jgi:hypothetical protein
MKFLESSYRDYINAVDEYDIHNNIIQKYTPKNIEDLHNTIIYGACGIGKYSQALSIIKEYSNSKLLYEKKILIETNKNNYYFKISDIHYEIDMELLGCNAKVLWNDFFVSVLDILNTKKDKSGIILCKNFHCIDCELLECFYSYIQKNYMYNIKLIILTEHISFIPNNILNSCNIIQLARPSKRIKKLSINKYDSNIKGSKVQITHVNFIDIVITDIINNIKSLETIDFNFFREKIYDLFTHNDNIHEFIYNILERLINEKILTSNEKMNKILLFNYDFLKYYNNNYRPIYHLENYLFNLINIIHEFK